MVADTTLDPRIAERERVVEELRQAAPRLCARGVTHLSLFGSIAHGDAGPESDVDLLIEVDPSSHFSLFDLVDLQDDLLERLARPTHFAFAVKLRPWLREEIRTEAISIS